MRQPLRVTCIIALGVLSACAKERPAVDTTAAATPAAAMPAPDTMKAATPAVPDSVKLMKQAKAAAPTKARTPGKIIGRDSVRQGPIIGIPTKKPQ